MTHPAKPRQIGHLVAKLLAILVSGLWIALCITYIARRIGIAAITALSPTQLGSMLLGIASVPGMIWMGLGFFAVLHRMERVNRVMVRHFRDFTKFSTDERVELTQSSQAARRESLSLFEAAQAALTSLNQLHGGLTQTTQALIDAAGKSTQAIDASGRQMEDRAYAVRSLSDEVHASAAALQDALARMERVQGSTTAIDAVADRLADAVSLLDTRRTQIERAGNDVDEKLRAIDRVVLLSNETTGRLEHATDRIHAGLDGIRGNIAETESSIDRYAAISERLQHYRDETGGNLNAIGDVATGVVAVLARMRSEQEAVGRDLENFDKRSADLEAVSSRMQEAFSVLNHKASEINFAVSTAVNRLGELSRGLQTARATIDETTNGASDKMSDIAAIMRSEFDGIHAVADRARTQLERTLASVAATSATLDSETQTLEQRIAATFRAAEAGSTEFNRQISAALGEIARAEQSFIDGQMRISGTARESSTHLLQLTAGLASGGAELGKAAMVISERIVAASGVVETRLQAVNEIGDQVRSAIGAFATDLGAVSQQGDDFTQKLADRGAILRDHVTQIARSAEEAAETVKATTEALLNTAVEISDAAGKTRTEIVRATAELKREGAAIADTEAQSRALAGQVAALLGERAMEMAQNARVMANETVTMREANAKFQRDSFLTATNTVLHTLTSLSVDIAQVLDTDLPEELRLELVRGDIPGFVRRLAALRGDVSTPKLRSKFATDTRFRTHVQTYLSQYEDLLAQAAKVDQGAVLSATLVGSDIGKIYTFLSAAISTGRDDLQVSA